MKLTRFAAMGAVAAVLLTACSTGNSPSGGDSSAAGSDNAEIRLWLVGTDTPQDLRDYLVNQFAEENPGSTLKIQEQSWGNLVETLTAALPTDNTPDVVEIGNTQTPTFSTAGAFMDLTDMYDELGGQDLVQSFVDVSKVDDKIYALPYYFGSRYIFYRKDIWQQAGVTVPTTLEQFNQDVQTLATANPLGIQNFSGLYMGGKDWRDGVSWIFANGGDLAKEKDGKWVSTLSDPKSIEGMKQWQQIQQTASKAPKDGTDAGQYIYLNDSDQILDENKNVTGTTSLSAATAMAPSWASGSLGDLSADGKTRVWNDQKFGVFALPGNDGKPAAGLAGGSNIAISAKTKHPELSKNLMKIIFSPEFQQMLGKANLGPGNTKYASALGDNEFAKASIEAAENSKLTPAAAGWAAVEGQQILESYFSEVASGGDVATLAKKYDDQIDAVING